MQLSNQILDDNAAIFEEMLGHRFVEDICADRLPDPVFRRYLALERAFVGTAIGMVGFALARAPDIGAQRWLIATADDLANKQVVYFEETFATLQIAPSSDLPPATARFCDQMLQIAETGSFLEIVTSMFAAEWMYWTWCKRAAAGSIQDPHLRHWVGMHAQTNFTEHALWLRRTIDHHGNDQDASKLSSIFAQVTRLEIDFHHDAYGDTPDAELTKEQLGGKH